MQNSKKTLSKLGLACVAIIAAVQFAGAQQLSLASLTDNGSNLCNQDVFFPQVSESGRYVAFNSSCPNVVTGMATNGLNQLYLRDLEANTTRLVSANAANTGGANDASGATDLSADGRFILFTSSATDLLPGGNTPGYFIRDLQTNTTQIVGMPFGWDRYCGPASISADGSVVITEGVAGFGHCETNKDIFAWNRVTGAVTNVSNGPRVGLRNMRMSYFPSISTNGRFVVFVSERETMVAGDNNRQPDVFVRDLQTGDLQLVSVNSAGTGTANGASSIRNRTYAVNERYNITPDGRYVTFASTGTDLVPNPTANDTGIFIRDLVSDTTIAAPKPAGLAASPSYFFSASQITPDGRFVIFRIDVLDPAAGYHKGHVCQFDRQTGISTEVSPDPNPIGYGEGYRPVGMSPDGRFVTYAFAAFYINHGGNVYVRDMQTGTTVEVFVAGGLDFAHGSLFVAPETGRVVFTASYSLLPADVNQTQDVYTYLPQPAGPAAPRSPRSK
jgi:Tol biopolymer transport system component